MSIGLTTFSRYMRLNPTLASIAYLVVSFPGGLSAQLVSNLSQTLAGSAIIGNAGEGSTYAGANSFTTGSNSGGYTLTSATITMGNATGSPTNFQLAVFSDSSGVPGSSLETLSGSSTPTTAGDQTYTSSSLALSASTTYFLVASATGLASDNNFAWSTTASDSETSSDGWTIGDIRKRNLNETSFVDHTTSSTVFSIQATAVPEPYQYAVVTCLGLFGVVAFRRLRIGQQAKNA
jgi:hypothetical protein